MKIRSSAELNDFLNEELAWRKKELTTNLFMVNRCRVHEEQPLIRGSICILYAHWEGFIKNSSKAYLNHVSTLGMRYCDLSPTLVTLCLRSKFRDASVTNKTSIHLEITDFILSDRLVKAKIPWASAIVTESNLNYELLFEILLLVGIDPLLYATKQNFVDEKLLRYRNGIAHGDRVEVLRSDFQDIYKEIFDLIQRFRDDLEASVIGKNYLK